MLLLAFRILLLISVSSHADDTPLNSQSVDIKKDTAVGQVTLLIAYARGIRDYGEKRFKLLPDSEKQEVLKLLKRIVFDDPKTGLGDRLDVALILPRLGLDTKELLPNLRDRVKAGAEKKATPEDREKAIVAASLLSQVKDKETAPQMLKLFEDAPETEPIVKQVAAQSLARLKDERALAALVKYVFDEKNQTKSEYTAIAIALKDYRDGLAPLIPGMLKEIAADESKAPRYLEFLTSSGDRRIVDALVKRVNDNLANKDYADSYLRSLLEMGPGARAARKSLEGWLTNDKLDPANRALVAEILGKYLPVESRDTLTSLVLDGKADVAVRHGALKGLRSGIFDEKDQYRKDHARAFLPETLKKLAELQSSTESWPAGMRTDLSVFLELHRLELPEKERDVLSIQHAKALTLPKKAPTDWCKMLCGMLDKFDKWSGDKVEGSPPPYFTDNHADFPKDAWATPIRTLQLYVTVQAAPFCPDHQRVKALPEEIGKLLSTTPGYLKRKEEKTAEVDVKEFIARIEAVTGEKMDAEMKKNIEKMNGASAQPLWYSADQYGMQWMLRLLDSDPKFLAKAKDADDLRKKTRTLYDDKMKIFDKLTLEKNWMNSLFGGYAVMTGMLATPNLSDSLITKMRDWAKSLPDPCLVPYYPFVDPKLQPRPDMGEAVARAPLLHMLLLQFDKDKTAQKLHHANAVKCTNRYATFSPLLAATVKTDLIHSGGGMSNFYFYTTAPFVMANLEKKLLAHPLTSKEDRGQLVGDRAKIEESLNSLVTDEGLFRNEGENPTEADIRRMGYIQPLAGLAIMPLIRECGGRAVTPPSGLLSILDVVEAKREGKDDREKSKTHSPD